MAMKRITIIVLLTIITLGVNSQTFPSTDVPQLEFALQLKVTLGEAYTIDNTQHGRRTIIPITGGTFEGPLLRGTIVSGGADYQLITGNRTQLEAIYCIKTEDGTYIHVRNRGIAVNGKDSFNRPISYFRTAPQFEAPSDSKYAWLNNALFICAPDFTSAFQGVILNVWKVK